MAMFRENKKPMRFSRFIEESNNVSLSEGFQQIKHIAKREDLSDLAQSYRKIVKTLKTKPGHEIVLVKTKEDEEYSKRTGIGDSSEVKIQKISGNPLGKKWTANAGKRQFTYEVIAINEDVSSKQVNETAIKKMYTYTFSDQRKAMDFKSAIDNDSHFSPIINVLIVHTNAVVYLYRDNPGAVQWIEKNVKKFGGKGKL